VNTSFYTSVIEIWKSNKESSGETLQACASNKKSLFLAVVRHELLY